LHLSHDSGRLRAQRATEKKKSLDHDLATGRAGTPSDKMERMHWEPIADQPDYDDDYAKSMDSTHTEEHHPKQMDWLLFMAANCQWRPPAADQQPNDAIDTAPVPPSAPSTPENPTRSISRRTPERKASRELSDTAIQPRALWATDTDIEGLAQEDILWIVAVHDAAVLNSALVSILAARGVAAALAGWKAAQAGEQAARQARAVGIGRQPAVSRQHADSSESVAASVGQPPDSGGQTTVNKQPPQQTAVAMASRQPQRWDPDKVDSEVWPMGLEAVGYKLYTVQWTAAEDQAASSSKVDQQRQQKKQQNEQQNRREQQQHDYTKKAADMQQHQQQWSPRQKPRQQVYKNTTSTRTLGANSPRAGDDWAD
jgi:hypothetical protein